MKNLGKIECSECGKELEDDGDWSWYNDQIVCDDCLDKIDAENEEYEDDIDDD